MAQFSVRNQITEGVIWKQLLIFFFPILLGTFFQQLYNTVDAVVVGRFVGKEALAAVGGSTGVLATTLVNFFVGLSSGATVIISQYYGAGDYKDTGRGLHTAVALAIASGLLISLLGVPGSSWAIAAIDTPPEVVDEAVTYLRIFMGGAVFALMFNIGSAILRALGDSRRPLYMLIICTVIHVALDLLFTAGFGWGVAGVAIATVTAEFVSTVLVWVILARLDPVYRLEFRKIRFDFKILRRIIRIGLPTGLESTMYSASNIIIQSTVNSFGVNAAAAWATFGKIDQLFWMIMTAFDVSITTFSGQNFGAQKYDRIKRCVNVGTGLALLITAIIEGGELLWGKSMLEFFTTDADVISLGMQIIWEMVPYYFFYIWVCVLSGATRGTGDTLIPMIITAFGICVYRVIWVWLVFPHWPTLSMVLYSYSTSWALTALLFILYYYCGGWLKRRIGVAEMTKYD